MSYLEIILVFSGVILVYILLDRLIRIPRLGTLDNCHVFITGCDSGFGRELAVRLDGKGCHVIAACLTDKGETELRKTCSHQLKTVIMNVADHVSVTKAFHSIRGDLPRGTGLWGLVNNAGVAGKGLRNCVSSCLLDWLTLDDYRETLSVNLLGMIDVTTTFLPLVKLQRGRIVNMSSTAGRLSFPGTYDYCISKFGVEAFSDGLRRQLRDTGVTVHTVEPGGHATGMTSAAHAASGVQRLWDENRSRIKLSQDEFEDIKCSVVDMAAFLKTREPHHVVDVYEHALFARFPRPRYVVGPAAFLMVHVISRLPEWASDAFFARMLTFKLPHVE